MLPHLLAILLISNIGNLSFLLKLIVILGALISAIYFLRLHIFQTLKHSVLLIRQDSVNNWFVLTAGESELRSMTLMTTSFVSNYFIILNYRLDDSSYLSKECTALITNDSLLKEEFRILKAKLKMFK